MSRLLKIPEALAYINRGYVDYFPGRGRIKQAQSCAPAATRALPLWRARRRPSTESGPLPKPTLIAKPADNICCSNVVRPLPANYSTSPTLRENLTLATRRYLALTGGFGAINQEQNVWEP
jgi:hypothetical protein